MSKSFCVPRIFRLHEFQSLVLLLAFLVLEIFFFRSLAFSEFDSNGWNSFRSIKFPPHLPNGLVGMALYSNIIENCRPDLNDIRIVSSKGSLVPHAITEAVSSQDPAALPVRIVRVAIIPGKWTDIWIDKSAKNLTRGVNIRTSSKNFIRKVEVRGANNAGESYVIKMDGLVADFTSPMSVRSLNVFYGLNNFQYIHLRIFDEDDPPLKIDRVSCYPPISETALFRPLDVRIIENRPEPSGSPTVTVADLGEKRFPITSFAIASSSTEFVKRVKLSCASSPSPEMWHQIFEGTFFRIRKDTSFVERLEAHVTPQTYRYMKLELSGVGPPATLDRLEATGAIRLVVFEYSQTLTYHIYYDNPNAKAVGFDRTLYPQNFSQLANSSSDISLSPEQKNSAKGRTVAKQPITSSSLTLGRVVVGGILLIVLVLFFSLMLRARSFRRSRKKGVQRNSVQGYNDY